MPPATIDGSGGFLFIFNLKVISMKYWILVLIVGFWSCSNDETPLTAGGAEHFIFGKFAGECEGEQCIEIYKFESGQIFEDQTDLYPDWGQGHRGTFAERPDADHVIDQLELIVRTLPSGLASEANRVFGCPDCADQGGIYVEVKDFGIDRIFWLFDNDLDEVPVEYHFLVERITEIVNQIE